ncbi:MAG: 2-hydroxychromene-2-carboxylate isomerase [Alphaproteobacteria bacterium]|nr:2-hydroxychromene-2-carboxylate isomerase [Alphaproteobacteria bacterium]
MTTAVDFYLGLGSRYSYLAASQIDRIEAQTGCRFVWKPIASGLLIDRRGDNPFRRATSPGAGPGPYDQAYREYDAKGWATLYGIPLHEPPAFEVDPTLPALACVAADRQGALVACCRLFQQLIFAEGRVIDASTIAALPARLGLDEEVFRRDLDAPEIRARHAALIDEAAQRGAFGVPTFFVGQQMFWGNDRLPLLEAALRGTELPRWREP